MEVLSGSCDNGIFKCEDTVVRPLSPSSKSVLRLLRYLHQQGFDACPQFIGIERDQEMLSYVEGKVYNYPLNGAITSEQA